MASLSELTHKLAAGTRLSDDDARQLAATTDLVTVGMLAAEARRVHAGEGVTYVRVAEIAYGAALPEEGWPDAAREIRISGTPASQEDAIAFVRTVSAGAGDCPVTGFSLVDLWQLADESPDTLKTFADALVNAGLSAVADVPVDRLPIAPAADALAAITFAGLAAPTARWDAAPADPIAALKSVRDLQAQTGVLRAFAPLPRPASSPAGPTSPSPVSAAGAPVDDAASASPASSGAVPAAPAPPQTGYDGVKLVALARVMLDNVPFIQVDWSRHGPKLAQVALLFGASDSDRVSPSDASPLGHRRAPLEEVQRNIAAAFLQPMERDGRFVRVSR